MPPLTIAAAARHCGVARRTLQRAIKAGRLTLTSDHQLTLEALQQAGYVAAPVPPVTPLATPQRYTAETPHVTPQDLSPFGDRLDRLDEHLTTLVQQIETFSRLLMTHVTPQEAPQRPTATTPQRDTSQALSQALTQALAPLLDRLDRVIAVLEALPSAAAPGRSATAGPGLGADPPLAR